MVIHAAAFTNVDGCESDPDTAYRANGLGTRNVAVAADEAGAAVAYVSTDYVFDGSQDDPYTEFDRPNPINVYGRSKLAGEIFVREFCRRYWIVRTSWLFGKHGKNFVQTFLRLARENDEIRVVNDQIGSPTYTRHLAAKIAEIVSSSRFGTYHVTNAGSCSWFQFAQEILRLRPARARVIPVASSEYATPAQRPKNSVLRNYVLQLEGMSLAERWEGALAAYLEECRE